MTGHGQMVSVVIPAFNEEASLEEVLASVRSTMEKLGVEYELIVVDDGSTDRTGEIAGAAGARVIRHPVNRGTGAARTAGVRQAFGGWVVMLDGDGTYPSESISALLQDLNEHDMVVGARRYERGTLPLFRRRASYQVGMEIPDLNSGMRAFKREAAMPFFGILPTTHSWVGTITLAFLANGLSVGFVPIDYFHRKGRSSFRPIRDTYNYLLLVIRTVMYFNPLKVLLPVSLAVVGLAVLTTLLHIVERGRILPMDIILFILGINVGALGLLADLIVVSRRDR
jgi:glycosyltransferase involved in cell wall biosynthesis